MTRSIIKNVPKVCRKIGSTQALCPGELRDKVALVRALIRAQSGRTKRRLRSTMGSERRNGDGPGFAGDSRVEAWLTDAQRASKADQTLADASQTSSDADPAACKRDRGASDRHQATADREHAAGVDRTAADESAYAASRDEWEAGSFARFGTLLERESAARNRDVAAGHRDRIADARDDWTSRRRRPASPHRLRSQHWTDHRESSSHTMPRRERDERPPETLYLESRLCRIGTIDD